MQPYAIPFFVFGVLMVHMSAPRVFRSRDFDAVIVFALGCAFMALAWVVPALSWESP